MSSALSPGKIGFVLRQVVWKERSHTYYQESLEPYRFHFLPDSFKVARRPETPHHPMLAVRFPNPDAAADLMPVTMEYGAGPYFDAERLEAAATEMKRKLPELAGSDRQIEFEPLLCDATRLFLTLPRGEAGPQREEREGAKIDLRTGILDAITLPMKDFQGLFDALFGDSAVVFQGEVVVEIDSGQGIPAEKVPVICRLADLIGDIFDVEVEQDVPSSGVRATLRNGIESPAEMRGLTAVLARGDADAEGVIAGLSFEAPIVLRPGEAVNCRVAPATALGGSGEVTVLVQLRPGGRPARCGRSLGSGRGSDAAARVHQNHQGEDDQANLRAATRSVFRSRVCRRRRFRARRYCRTQCGEAGSGRQSPSIAGRLHTPPAWHRRISLCGNRHSSQRPKQGQRMADGPDRNSVPASHRACYRIAVNGASNVSRKSD